MDVKQIVHEFVYSEFNLKSKYRNYIELVRMIEEIKTLNQTMKAGESIFILPIYKSCNFDIGEELDNCAISIEFIEVGSNLGYDDFDIYIPPLVNRYGPEERLFIVEEGYVEKFHEILDQVIEFVYYFMEKESEWLKNQMENKSLIEYIEGETFLHKAMTFEISIHGVKE